MKIAIRVIKNSPKHKLFAPLGRPQSAIDFVKFERQLFDGIVRTNKR